MDMVVKLHVDLILTHIIPRLDYTSWIRAACVSKQWMNVFRMIGDPPAGGVEGIPWIWLTNNLWKHSLLCPPFTHTSPHRPHMIQVTTGDTIASCRQHLMIRHVVCGMHITPIFICNLFSNATTALPEPPPNVFSGALSRNFADGSFVAAVYSTAAQSVFICRSGDDHDWTWAFEMKYCQDLIFSGGSLYAIRNLGELHVYDVGADFYNHVRVEVPKKLPRGYEVCTNYLVESCYGELLVVSREVNSREHWERFTVYKMDFEAEKLVKVNDLGDQMLFVGKGCSSCVLHKSGSWPSTFFTANAIYFFNSVSNSKRKYARALGKFSLSRRRMRKPNKSFTFHRDEIYSFLRPIWILLR